MAAPVLGQVPPDSSQTEVREAWLSQAGAAALGGALVVAGGVGLTMGLVRLSSPAARNDMTVFAIGVLGTLAAIPAGGAAGTGIVGRHNRQDGRFGPAYLGGLVAIPVGVLVAGTGIALTGGSVSGAVVSTLVGLVAPAVGATYGYNLSRSADNRKHAWLERLEPPALALRATMDEEREVKPTFDCRLVTVKF